MTFDDALRIIVTTELEFIDDWNDRPESWRKYAFETAMKKWRNSLENIVADIDDDYDAPQWIDDTTDTPSNDRPNRPNTNGGQS